MINEKITEAEMLARLRVGSTLLAPLVVQQMGTHPISNPPERGDGRIELTWPGNDHRYLFVVEVKTRATPAMIYTAIAQARAATRENEHPMIHVPYLSPERLDELEREKVSGVDLCGNGIVIVPGRLLVRRSGEPNRYRDSRPLNNPYRGRSAMVARMLLTGSPPATLGELVTRIRDAGAVISLSQASKAVTALEEERLIWKLRPFIKLQEPSRLLDRLGSAWRKPDIRVRQGFRLPKDSDWAAKLSSDPSLRWTVTGESSASRYVMFSQGGPRRIAVSNLLQAAKLLGGTSESIPNFADVELLETDEPGFYFQVKTDPAGVRWASPLQTWLELQAGDARQQEAAKDLRLQILK